jgi:hypothetical protein
LPRRYTSQRFDHATSDSSHTTSYVKITFELGLGLGGGGKRFSVVGILGVGYSEYLVV